ncbi:MAG TPA: hypothetical protein GX514_00935 [Thermoanaerobacterales bacterium]|uniref:hypothetical protein n=1 Tax=Tepidanaerobacter sp. GT38 TaxID=2722793 RepID=UPI0017CA0077|nr:hypothetical protein [Tepidanaerobacter sp. GT38]MCG1012657.1 hypothetical protein [Tepidanaerobacter sp. GT38]HHY41408.1 hypothetical protein [Thermoanaerobacterales bacterium]
MFVDLIGIFLTVIIVSPRYWFIVLLLSFIESAFTVLISMALQSSITEVVAGGIFTTVTGSFNNNLITIICPFLLLLFGIGLHRAEKIPWLDLLNPIADFKRPLPVLMIKTALCRILIISLLSSK